MSAVVAPDIIPIRPQTDGDHHLAIRCTNEAWARVSHAERLGVPVLLERLYFGRNIGDAAVVSDSAWAAFVGT